MLVEDPDFSGDAGLKFPKFVLKFTILAYVDDQCNIVATTVQVDICRSGSLFPNLDRVKKIWEFFIDTIRK